MTHKAIYVLSFKVTHTSQNGKEQRTARTVNIDPFRNGKHLTPVQQKEIAASVLKERGFYNIEYMDTKTIKVY